MAKEKSPDRAKKAPKKRKPAELLGLDFGTSAIKAVRLRKNKGQISLVQADIFAPVDFVADPSAIHVPKTLLTHYAALCYSGEHAFARVINLDSSKETPSEAYIREQLNVDNKYRAVARPLGRIPGRQEWGFLGVAVPETTIKALLAQVPAGPPAPFSIELASFANFTAWLHGASEAEKTQEAVCLIEGGESTTCFAFINKGTVCFVGKYNIGCRALRNQIREEMGMDDDLAASILRGDSIDISASISKVAGGLLRQLAISRDFMERHHKCQVRKIVMYGGVSGVPYFCHAVAESLSAELRRGDPFLNIQVDQEVLPERVLGQEYRLGGAVGAALGGLIDEE
jgi:Tfp pilus assembly PilM family ATPase